jgi:hypothetical protein
MMSKFGKSEPPPSTAEARRDAARVKLTCLAWIEDGGAQLQGIARAVDLTTKGVGMILSRAVPTGQRVVVELMLSGPLRLRAQGAVVHSTALPDGQFRVGVKLDAAPVLVDSNDKGGP